MHAVAGNRPLRPFRPPMHGDSKSPELKLLWNGSSHARFCHSSETHLKQSIPASGTNRERRLNIIGVLPVFFPSPHPLYAYVYNNILKSEYKRVIHFRPLENTRRIDREIEVKSNRGRAVLLSAENKT